LVNDFSNGSFSIVEQEQLHEGATCNDTATPTSLGQNMYRIDLTGITCTYTGTMCIDLYSSNNHFGIIWIFDSESISYKGSTNTGTQEVIIENGGIIYSGSDDNHNVKRTANVYYEGNSLAISIIQTFTSSKFSSSGGAKVRMNAYLYSSIMMETITVYDLRLQFSGDHQDDWLKYYNNNYHFEHDSEPLLTNSLVYTPSKSSGGAWFNLADSIIRFSLQ
jgi:hypothetical protein